MWALIGIVVAAGVAMAIVGRTERSGSGQSVDDVDDSGLVVDGEAVPWSSVFRVDVMTRRALLGTWYGFEVHTEEAGLIVIDDRGRGLAERFLAHTYQLPGFDHATVTDTLGCKRAREVCYNR